MIQGSSMMFSRRSLPIARPSGEHMARRQNFSSSPFESSFVLWKKLIAKSARFCAGLKSGMKGALSSLFKIRGGNAYCCAAVLLRSVWKCVAAMNSTSSAQPTPNFLSGNDKRLTSSVKRDCAVENNNNNQIKQKHH